MRRFLVLLVTVFIPVIAPRALAQRAVPNRVVIVTQGMRVTVSMPLHSYPRNALVRVWIGLRNVSNQIVYVPATCAGPSNPYITVLTGLGQQVFPPLIPAREPHGPPVAACRAARPMPLKPGQALHWEQYAVLRGAHIVVHVGLAGPDTYGFVSSWSHVRLSVHLTSPDTPSVTIQTAPSTEVLITSAPGSGPLLVSEWWFCPGDIRANGAHDAVLERVRGNRSAVPCAHPTDWHGVVGRMNHSVARFDYPAVTSPCATRVTLTLHPGLPPGSTRLSLSAPRDIPPGPLTVSAPLYPGATPLRHFVASPIWTYPETPYLQTDVAEYRTKADMATVERWYRSGFASCGWRPDGTMGTNTSILDAGLNFASNTNPHLEMYMTFGITPWGGAYIAYAAEDETLPPRPAASYLRGPFSEIRVAYSFNDYSHPQTIHYIVHIIVRDRATIRRFVMAINAITDVLAGTYKGGGLTNGPAWLSFMRPDSSTVHVWATVLALQVDHTRTLHDSQRVSNLITGLVHQHRKQ